MSQSTHARENVDIFCRFLSVAPFRVDHDSVRLEAPPKPDASCLRDGELSYFELVRAVDPGIAEDQSGLRRAAERSPFGMAAGPAITSVFGAGFFEAIDRKGRKRYDTGGAPVDLLIWIDRRVDPFAADAWPHIREDFRSLVDAYRGRWRTVWVFDPETMKILFPERHTKDGGAQRS